MLLLPSSNSDITQWLAGLASAGLEPVWLLMHDCRSGGMIADKADGLYPATLQCKVYPMHVCAYQTPALSNSRR